MITKTFYNYRSNSVLIKSFAPFGPVISNHASLLSPLIERLKTKKSQHSLSVLTNSASSSTHFVCPYKLVRIAVRNKNEEEIYFDLLTNNFSSYPLPVFFEQNCNCIVPSFFLPGHNQLHIGSFLIILWLCH
jgi:hypothetical protein